MRHAELNIYIYIFVLYMIVYVYTENSIDAYINTRYVV